MSYSAKITGATKERVIKDGYDVIDVSFDILLNEHADDGEIISSEVVAERRLAFPIDSDEETIKEEVRKYCKMFEEDHASVAKAEAERAVTETAEETMTSLIGQEL